LKLTAPLAMALCALSAPALGDTLRQVRIDAPDAPKVAQRLTASGFDVLEGSITAGSFEVIAPADGVEQLRRMGLNVTLIATGRPFAAVQREAQTGAGADGVVPPGYLNLAQIQTQMNDRAASFPNICKVVDLTATYGTPATAQGRHMFAVKISDNVNADEDEPASLIVACHHAREVGTPVVALDTIDRLLNGYGVDPVITALVNDTEIWVAPVWNPDGYNHVFTVDNLWRKNRRANSGGSFGVDLNRNYPFGWTASCSGTTSQSSETYKGPSAGSEPETQTMTAWSTDRNFAKVLDYHSYGRETLYGYLCLTHPLTTFLGQEAAAVSSASGYGGVIRDPSAEGEEQESQLAHRGALGFLTEIGTAFQPSYASSLSEATMVWGGTRALLTRAIPVSGHVTSAATGLPVVATITYSSVNFVNGETNKSQARFGRYHVFLPAGSYTITYTAAGFVPAQRVVQVGAGTGQTVDVALQPVAPPCYANCDGSTIVPVLNVNDFICFQTKFAAGDPTANCDASTIPPVLNVNDFLCFQTKYAAGCP
jgi:hypothetical protein